MKVAAVTLLLVALVVVVSAGYAPKYGYGYGAFGSPFFSQFGPYSYGYKGLYSPFYSRLNGIGFGSGIGFGPGFGLFGRGKCHYCVIILVALIFIRLIKVSLSLSLFF